MSEVTQKSDNSSSQMRLLGELLIYQSVDQLLRHPSGLLYWRRGEQTPGPGLHQVQGEGCQRPGQGGALSTLRSGHNSPASSRGVHPGSGGFQQPSSPQYSGTSRGAAAVGSGLLTAANYCRHQPQAGRGDHLYELDMAEPWYTDLYYQTYGTFKDNIES